MTKEEFNQLSRIFYRKLSDAMSNAGCNDVCKDEYPESICQQFKFDFDVLNAWFNILKAGCTCEVYNVCDPMADIAINPTCIFHGESLNY